MARYLGVLKAALGSGKSRGFGVTSSISSVNLSKSPTLFEPSVWKGAGADVVDTLPISLEKLPASSSAEVPVDLTASHLRYQHLPASLLELFPGASMGASFVQALTLQGKPSTND